MNIHIKEGIQTYAYYSDLSGMKGIITEKELPELIKIWKKNGGTPILDTVMNDIRIYSQPVTNEQLNEWNGRLIRL